LKSAKRILASLFWLGSLHKGEGEKCVTRSIVNGWDVGESKICVSANGFPSLEFGILILWKWIVGSTLASHNLETVEGKQVLDKKEKKNEMKNNYIFAVGRLERLR